MIVKTVTREIVDGSAFAALRRQPPTDFLKATFDLLAFEKQYCEVFTKVVGTNFVRTMFFSSDASYNDYLAAEPSQTDNNALIESRIAGILSEKTESVEIK